MALLIGERCGWCVRKGIGVARCAGALSIASSFGEPRPLTILPDEWLVALQSVLDERVDLATRLVSPGSFLAFADSVMRAMLTYGFQRAGADEGTLCLPDEARENLVVGFQLRAAPGGDHRELHFPPPAE